MRRLILIFSVLFTSLYVIPQTGVYGQNTDQHITPVSFQKGVELYQSGNYIAAERIFIDLSSETSENDPVKYDLDYYRLMCLVKQNKRSSESEINAYLTNNKNNPHNNQLQFEMGKLQFSNRRYPLAVRTLSNIDPQMLKASDRDDFYLYRAYSNFEAGNLAEASQEFFDIKKSNSKYAPTASYYWGYINYLEGNYNTALEEFAKIKNNKQFSGFINFYTIQIYYIQERYAQVIEMGPSLLTAAPADQKNDLNKIVGDAYYLTQNYINAIQYLEAYQGISKRKTPEDYFRLAYCYYKIEEYDDAIKNFEKASVGKNEVSQLAFYHLADCYLKIDDKNKARIAFEQASKYDFDKDIEQDALFNFAKLTYELSYSPFNETIKAFDQYITKYPDSERNDQAFDYLVKVYMTTRNYRGAIASIEKIKNQSPSIKEAYQRVTYYHALELLNDGYYTRAIEMFEKSLENKSYNRSITAKSLYWNAEANYRLTRYSRAIELFQQFQSTAGAFSLPEFGTAYYNIGYAYFNMKNYSEASSWFRKYLNQSKREAKLEADAGNRIADSYFIIRNYKQALEYYQKAFEIKSYDADYSLFQIALCHGLLHNYSKKIEQLQILLNDYYRSSYSDDALYEIARTYERNNDISNAISWYKKIIAEKPQSHFVAKAHLQLGLIYYNKSDFNNSLENYKNVVEKYPNSEEAKSALVGIQNNYVDQNNVDGYFAYLENIDSKIAVTASKQDSVYYMAAEKSFMDENPQAGKMLLEYLEKFPDGSFRINALFYLAEFHYGQGEYSKSLTYYDELLLKPNNIFTEQALVKAAELMFNAEKYTESLDYFIRLENLAGTKWNLLRSRLGIMRCQYALNNAAETVKSAVALLETENTTQLMVREANYKLAKSHYLLGEEDEALKFFKILATDAKTTEGAEAKYFIAQIFYNKENFDDAENEIMEFISANTPHQYWLAKSFILLSDVYMAKEDIFQAKHTLKSIVNNYTNTDDGIIAEAEEKIKNIETIEKETVITSENNEE